MPRLAPAYNITVLSQLAVAAQDKAQKPLNHPSEGDPKIDIKEANTDVSPDRSWTAPRQPG